MICSNIRRCDESIAKQKKLVAQMQEQGNDQASAEAMLDRLVELRSLFTQFRAEVIKRLNAVRL